jgi:hypothetical protein
LLALVAAHRFQIQDVDGLLAHITANANWREPEHHLPHQIIITNGAQSSRSSLLPPAGQRF